MLNLRRKEAISACHPVILSDFYPALVSKVAKMATRQTYMNQLCWHQNGSSAIQHQQRQSANSQAVAVRATLGPRATTIPWMSNWGRGIRPQPRGHIRGLLPARQFATRCRPGICKIARGQRDLNKASRIWKKFFREAQREARHNRLWLRPASSGRRLRRRFGVTGHYAF
jgi:hypothetical protein